MNCETAPAVTTHLRCAHWLDTSRSLSPLCLALDFAVISLVGSAANAW